jgi:hypothetical protein
MNLTFHELLALMEWLLVVGPGQDEAWAHQAIQECKRRQKKE